MWPIGLSFKVIKRNSIGETKFLFLFLLCTKFIRQWIPVSQVTASKIFHQTLVGTRLAISLW